MYEHPSGVEVLKEETMFELTGGRIVSILPSWASLFRGANLEGTQNLKVGPRGTDSDKGLSA